MHYIEVVDPRYSPSWPKWLESFPDASVFHSAAWLQTLAASYGYRPYCLVLHERSRVLAMLPVLEVDSWVTGRRGISLPFTDVCSPLVRSGSHFRDLFQALLDYGRKRHWKYVELRSGSGYLEEALPSQTFMDYRLELQPDVAAVRRQLRPSTRRNIKKARRAGVRVVLSHSFRSVKEFYRLNCETRRNHGVPPQPFSFFRVLHRQLIARGLGMVSLGLVGERVISADVFLQFGSRVVYKYGASERRYLNTRASYLVMWEGIKWYAERGYRSLCMGRTDLHHDGLKQFKRGWGTREVCLKYHRYDLVRDRFVENRSLVSGPHNEIIQRMPIWLLRVCGQLLYRHLS